MLHARKVHGRQGTMKDVVTLQEEKAAMDAMVESSLKKGDPDNPIFEQMQKTAASANFATGVEDNSCEERVTGNEEAPIF